MIIKGRDGKEITIQKRDAGFVCPECKALVASLACPKPDCGAPVPANYCPTCGYPMGAYTCEACGQPAASRIAGEAVDTVADAVAEAVEAVVADQLPGILADLAPNSLEIQSRSNEDEGIVEAYLTGEVKDKHSSLPETVGLLRFAMDAKIDQEHDKQAIEGVKVMEATPVKRNIAGRGVVNHGKVTIRHDMKVPAARDAFEKVKAGQFTGLSAYFYIPKALDARIKAGAARGQTTVIPAEDIDSMPFISYVRAPSCPVATIENFRSDPATVVTPAPEAVVVAPVADVLPTDRFTALKAVADSAAVARSTPNTPEVPQVPPAPEVPAPEFATVPQVRSEMASLAEQARQAAVSDVSKHLNEHVAPAVEAVQAFAERAVEALRSEFDSKLAEAKRSYQKTLDKLCLAEPTHDAGTSSDTVEAARADQPAEAKSKRLEFPAIGLNLSR